MRSPYVEPTPRQREWFVLAAVWAVILAIGGIAFGALRWAEDNEWRTAGAARVRGAPERVDVGEVLHLEIEVDDPPAPCPTFVASYGESGTAVFERGQLRCDGERGVAEVELVIRAEDGFSDGSRGAPWVRLED